MDKQLLPLGSVVKLKGSPTKIMIVGYGPISSEVKKYYEYLGVNYPFGIGEKTEAVMFDNWQIEILCFTSYTDEKSNQFYNAMDKIIGKQQY